MGLTPILFCVACTVLILPHGLIAGGEGEGTVPITLSGEADGADANACLLAFRQEQKRRLVVSCEEIAPPYERHVQAVEPALDGQLSFRGLKPNTPYGCMALSAEGSWVSSNLVRITTAPLPENLVVPQVTVQADRPDEVGYVLFNTGKVLYDGDMANFDLEQVTSQDGFLVIMDAEGHVRWYLEGPGAGDFEARYLGNDAILFGGQSVPQAYPPTIVGLDKQERIRGPQLQAVPYEMEDEYGLYYNHDAQLSVAGDSIFTLVHTTDPEDEALIGFVIKEIPLEDQDEDGALDAIRWYWDAFEAVQAGELSLDNALNPDDPFHPNTVFQEAGEDGRLYVFVSLRNNNQVLKIDYDTKEVVWSMGYGSDDFILLDTNGRPAEDSRWFFNQHDVQYSGGLMTVYDDGMDRYLAGGVPYSRALVLDVDEARRVVRIVHEYTETGWLEPFWGGYDLAEDGSQLIAMGHCAFCDIPLTHNSALVVLDWQNRVLWRADFLEDEDQMIYRAQQIGGCDLFHNLSYCPEAAGEFLETGARSEAIW